ncbi:aldose 1-epimerase family protein [Cytophagaceae bacterium YF14B1]|uniref:Aldose 1-epimerase family protein n=1 Tax=Xanthocytophaga flava TaxID=3048013 RepID=A0AAE3QYH0_9BACT|nr:aldose 1-epimerase family protein [Xanthocytophaga flavus]MDJ1484808.1 aldose 1-epimerase family protein [Xanthocytophaga flavus]
MYTIENELIKITINPKGAELSSIFHKQYKLEYLWQADPAYWAKKSPVLFPIVGTLKQNTYYFNNKAYHLSRHGFARDRSFIVSQQQEDAITFALTSDMESLEIYPFVFEFLIHYQLQDNRVLVTYEVVNPASEDLYFSVGGHPAFNVPLVPDTTYEDYFLQFEKTEMLNVWPITADGLIEDRPEPFLGETDALPLKKSLFYKDALVFKHLQSSRISLLSAKTEHGLEMAFEGFPFFGIWGAKDANFVCLEPWCGIADPVSTNQQLPYKEGIIKLPTQSRWKQNWQLTLF